MSAIDRLETVQTRILDAYTSTQEPVADAVTKVVERLEERLPQLPTAERLGEWVPTARELADNQFGFAAKVLDATQDLVNAVLDAAEPVTTKVVAPAPGKAAKTVKKVADDIKAA
jgi:hypothetical protein